jgi:hypothetical protein
LKILASVGSNKSGANKTYYNLTSKTYSSDAKIVIEEKVFEGSWTVAPFYDTESKDGAKSDS